MRVHLFVLVCVVVYLFSHTPQVLIKRMDNVLYSHSTKTQDVDTFFGSEKISSCFQGSGPFKKMVLLELNR